MILIAGLGNPGRLYLHSRHNAGFHVVELLAKRHGLDFEHRKSKAMVARGHIAGADIVLAKPQTFMNGSGASVVPLLHSLHLSPADLLVVYDDLDLPVGVVRLRPNGSAGGHHGMESIIAHLGSREFPRLRIGIGRPGDSRSPDEIAEYVLRNATASERSALAEGYAHAADAIEYVLAEGLAAAMNRFNVT
jgi:peptidyl-tRNA hydrolase, PTH1 family